MKRVTLATMVALSAFSAAAQAQSLGGREVVLRAQKMTGSDSVMTKHKTMTMTGTLNLPSQGVSAPVVNMKSADNMFRLTITVDGYGTVEQGYAEGTGYSISPGVEPAVLTGKALAQSRRQAEWRDKLDDYVSITNEGQEMYAGRNTYKVKLVSKDSVTTTRYYDVETGYQHATVSSQDTPDGPVEVITVMSDYKNFGGMMISSKQTQQVNGTEQIITLEKIEFDTAPASAFELPAVIKALKK